MWQRYEPKLLRAEAKHNNNVYTGLHPIVEAGDSASFLRYF
jgi:hypothetical protein